MTVVNWKLVGMVGDAEGSDLWKVEDAEYMLGLDRREGFDRRIIGIGRWNCCRERERQGPC